MNDAANEGAIVVTGAAQGIGFSIARRFAQAGRPVVIADLRGASEAAARLGTGTLGIEVDVGEADQVDAMMDRAAQAFGGIAVLVNNAAVYTSLRKQPFEEIEPAEWRQVFRVNVEGVWYCSRAAARYMKSAGRGVIVNIGSAAVAKGNAHLLHYVGSKGAVIAMTRTLARELGPHGIRVNTVSPGFTQSDGILAGGTERDQQRADTRRQRVLQRDIDMEDVAGAVLYLAGPDAGMFTGQNLIVDGGMVMN